MVGLEAGMHDAHCEFLFQRELVELRTRRVFLTRLHEHIANNAIGQKQGGEVLCCCIEQS